MIEHYRSDETFRPVSSYTDRDTGQIVQAPFPVAVSGIGHPEPFLGIGTVIGSIKLGDTDSDHPVIELSDVHDGQFYTVLGCESYWTWPVPTEVLGAIETGQLAIESVREYLLSLETESALVHAEDDGWLRENDIDPETDS